MLYSVLFVLYTSTEQSTLLLTKRTIRARVVKVKSLNHRSGLRTIRRSCTLVQDIVTLDPHVYMQ